LAEKKIALVTEAGRGIGRITAASLARDGCTVLLAGRKTEPWLNLPQGAQACQNKVLHGKAERFIQTALREWAYVAVHPNSERWAQNCQIWLHRYNWYRLQGGLV